MIARLCALAGLLASALFAQESGPLRVPGYIQEWKLEHQERPVYPELARQMRITGTVRLAVLIGRDGNVEELRVIRGHPLLVKAAMDAVKDWRWRPTYRLGHAIKVFTTVDITFSIGGLSHPTHQSRPKQPVVHAA